MKSSNIARIVLSILFILFVGLYLVGNSNYYDYEASIKTRLTEEQIKQFEEDISEGKAVDVENYLELNKKDYANPISDTTLKISKTISESFEKGLYFVFEKINQAMEEN